jgi:sugar lactone lactonase YvrE
VTDLKWLRVRSGAITISHFGERGINLQQFESPSSLSFDSEGHLYVVDARRSSFRIFDPDGTLLLVVGGGKETSHKLGFGMPVAVFVDRFDRVIITDLQGGRVTVWQYLSAKDCQRAQPKQPASAISRAV